MADSDLEKAVEKISKDIDTLMALREKLETAFGKSKEADKNEDREFQLGMFEVQRGYDTLNSVLTVVMAVAYSYIIAITTILFTVTLSQFAQTYLFVVEAIAIIIAAGSSYLLMRYHKSVPKKLEGIRSQFIKNNKQKDKQ